MAVITYSFSSGSEAGANWTSLNDAWDGNLASNANRFVNSWVGQETDKWIQAETNNAPASGGSLISIEVGIYFETGYSGDITANIVPVFNGSTFGDIHSLGAKTSSDWGYVDITNDTNAPGSWDWTDIQNLDLRCYGGNMTPSQGFFRIYEFSIRVTYSEVVESYKTITEALGLSDAATITLTPINITSEIRRSFFGKNINRNFFSK